MVRKSLGLVGLPALLEAEAIPVHLQDIDMVGETVEEGPGEPFRAKDLGPLVEGQVGGSQDRAAFIALAEDLEEQLGPGLGQGYEAQFVDDQELETRQLPLQVEQPPFVPGLNQLVDQSGGRGETHGQSSLTRSQAETEGDVGLAGAAVANSDDVILAVDVFAPGQLQHQGFVERGDSQEVEGVQALYGGETGLLDPALHHAVITVDKLQLR